LLRLDGEATFARIWRIQFTMQFSEILSGHPSLCAFFRVAIVAAALCFLGMAQQTADAQQPPEGPMDPPPEHRVTRIDTTPEPPEPPPIPSEQMIK
jgi:hypothetical protein